MICIRNDMVGFAPCATRGEHLASCAGGDCRGCRPREAKFGMLCAGCYARIEKALTEHWTFTRMLEGVEVAVTSSGGGGGHAGPRVPLSALRLDRDELWSMVERLPGEADECSRTVAGAEAALLFARRMEQVARTHPWEEKSAPVQITRCPRCAKRSLRWEPPAGPLSPVTVVCADPRCGYSMGQDRFEVLADMEDRLTRGRRPLGAVEQWVQEFREGRWSVWAAYPRWPSVDEVEARFGAEVWLDA